MQPKSFYVDLPTKSLTFSLIYARFFSDLFFFYTLHCLGLLTTLWWCVYDLADVCIVIRTVIKIWITRKHKCSYFKSILFIADKWAAAAQSPVWVLFLIPGRHKRLGSEQLRNFFGSFNLNFMIIQKIFQWRFPNYANHWVTHNRKYLHQCHGNFLHSPEYKDTKAFHSKCLNSNMSKTQMNLQFQVPVPS